MSHPYLTESAEASPGKAYLEEDENHTIPDFVLNRVNSEPGSESKRKKRLESSELLQLQMNRLTPEDRADVLRKLNPEPPRVVTGHQIMDPSGTIIGVLVGLGLAFAAWKLTNYINGGAIASVATEMATEAIENLPTK